jgi:hypothetical protein
MPGQPAAPRVTVVRTDSDALDATVFQDRCTQPTYVPQPDHCEWDERGYLVWKLPLHQGAQRSRATRNDP